VIGEGAYVADKDDVDPSDPGFYRRVHDFKDDAKTLAPPAFAAKHGEAFLLHHGPIGTLNTPMGPQATVMVVPTQNAGEAPQTQSDFLVFLVKRSGRSPFPNFVSVGRTRNNDVVIADISLSKFHAFFKLVGSAMQLQDAGSKNGTFLDDERVPTQQNGPPMAITTGSVVRFGSVDLTFLDAEAFANLVKMLT
jgi:hypothetical protein